MDHLNRILIKELEVLGSGRRSSRRCSRGGKNRATTSSGRAAESHPERARRRRRPDQGNENWSRRSKRSACPNPSRRKSCASSIVEDARRGGRARSRAPIRLSWRSLNKRSDETIDLPKTKTVLDADHSGLEKAKDRILEYLAVRKLNPEVKGPILCFVDLQASARLAAKSIATSSAASSSALGGMRDEAEIRGHRRRIGASG